ncbi:MAG: lysylphosphatidylglycerol synthase transmembrane domain-containing protein [Bryobacteraceae bacterium]
MKDPAPKSGRHRLLILITYLISIASLAWALRDAHLGELKDDLATMNWGWVGLAALFNLALYFFQAIRWQFVLRPIVRTTYGETLRAIFVGLFANEVLPLRAGEVLRCYMISRNKKDLPVTVSLSSALIERIFDGIWLTVFLFFVLRFVALPRGLQFLSDGATGLGITVLAIAVVLGVALFHRQQWTRNVPERGWRRHFYILITDLEKIGNSRYFWFAFVQSLPLLLIQTLPVWAAFYGYGFDLSMGTAFLLALILRLGSAVPQAPGNLGLFQFLAREALEKLFHVAPDEAARFSLVLWGIVTLPLMVAGLISLAMSGLRLQDLREEADADAALDKGSIAKTR